MANPKRNLTLDGHGKKISSLAFSPNAHIIASGSYDNSVRLWFPGSSTKTRIIKGHTAPVRSVDFLRDGRSLLTAGDDKSVKLWDVETLKFKGSYIGHTNWVVSAKANK